MIDHSNVGVMTAGRGPEETTADIVDRMAELFGPRLSRMTIVSVVRRCRRELEIVQGRATPIMLERLAFQRLATRGDELSP